MDELRKRARKLRNNPTDAERHLWRVLRLRHIDGFRFRRQVPIAGYIVDFVCPQAGLVVELDGGQHADRTAYDHARTRLLEMSGYRVLRYWNDDVLLRTDDVIDDIHRELTKGFAPPRLSPSPSERQGE
jgi:very-short-patch-repair endonuclease